METNLSRWRGDRIPGEVILLKNRDGQNIQEGGEFVLARDL